MLFDDGKYDVIALSPIEDDPLSSDSKNILIGFVTRETKPA